MEKFMGSLELISRAVDPRKMTDDMILNDLEEALKKSEYKLQTEILKREAWEFRLQEQVRGFSTQFDQKFAQISDSASSVLKLSNYEGGNDLEEILYNSTLDFVPYSKDLVEELNSDQKVMEKKLEVGVEEIEDGDALIKCWIGKELRKPIVVSVFSKSKVATFDEWKVFDKMSMKELESAAKQGKEMCIDDNKSSRMGVDIMARHIPKLPPKSVIYRETYFMLGKQVKYEKITLQIIHLIKSEKEVGKMLSVLQSDKKIGVCGVILTDQRALQFLRGGKAKLHVAMSCHCLSKCYFEALQHHYVFHECAVSALNENETKENANFALTWVRKFVTKNFSLLGIDETDDSLLLLKESNNVFKFYASGRGFYLGLVVMMELKSRYDLILRLYNVWESYMGEIIFEIYMNDDSFDQLLFTLIRKELEEILQKEPSFLQRFASLINHPNGRKWVTKEMQVSYTIGRDENGNHKFNFLAICKKFSVEEIYAQILRKLVDDVSHKWSGKLTTKSIIKVLGYFNDSQRWATKCGYWKWLIQRMLDDSYEDFGKHAYLEHQLWKRKDACFLHELAMALMSHPGSSHSNRSEVKAVAEEMEIRFLGIGFKPKWRREDIPIIPKGRYTIMKNYMPKVGSFGLDMMFRTCTVQVNLDFDSEADMIRKFQAGLAIQPIATALFANSPFTEGKPNGYLSMRSQI
ncbi:glutamate-cysteine ligase [Perilla frutescens var. frutescens]|nr:glutamate-cysteine ligase [Perilla frutescens var. frutescens]